VPFAGSAEPARDVIAAVAAALGDEDELIFVDNNASPVAGLDGLPAQVRVLRAAGRASSYHARNAGAAQATRDWLVFCDGDTRPLPGWLDALFDPAPGERTAVLGGGVRDSGDGATFAERLQRDRLGMAAEMVMTRPDHPYAITANAAVRARAFRSVDGFAEVISGGDADLCWRLAGAGWDLETRPAARVEHRNRSTMRALWSQRFRHGRGAAWLETRFPGRLAGGGVTRTAARAARAAAGAAVRPRDSEARMRAAEASLWLAHEVGRLRSNEPARR
jgi:GT2 family glycosyltransferase